MIKREANFGLLLRKWVKSKKLITCVFELKQTTKDSIPFSCLEESQIDWLRAVKSDRGVIMRNQGGNGEPDYSYFRNEPAYVVIKYPNEFSVIDVDTFLMEKKRSQRKSLTATRAKELSTYTVKC